MGFGGTIGPFPWVWIFIRRKSYLGISFVVSTIFFAKVLIDWFEGKELATATVYYQSWPFGTRWAKRYAVVGFFRLALGVLYCTLYCT